jgi:elongation factor Ts
MSSENLLEKVKKLRELTGVGFKDCKNALDENGGDIDKSIDYLRKKGIAKANKKMERVAADGLVCVYEKDNNYSMIEINSETDFVAKNIEFINFAEEVSELSFNKSGNINEILSSKMKNNKSVKESLVDLISKIGEKITLRRCVFIDTTGSINFSYIHSSLKKNIGKLGVLIAVETNLNKNDIIDFGKQLSMQVAATSPLAIDKEDLDDNILKKEKDIIMEELKNNGKDSKIIDKIANGKLNKFISDNTLMNQEWIMDPKQKVKDIIKSIQGKGTIKIKSFNRFKVGEGI